MTALTKVMLVFGTRPEAIKMAPLYHALRASEKFSTTLCVTAQHRQMLDQVLRTFSMTPDFDLDLMRPGQDLFDVTGTVLYAMRDALRKNRPDFLLVHGDTTTTMASAVAAFYERIPVGHVEAGLRTRNLAAPFPEEFNRQVADRIARWHFAPTERARRNLLAEGIDPSSITVTGNTVIDAVQWILARINREPSRQRRLSALLQGQLPFPWKKSRFVLVTGHRRESFGEGLLQICRALRDLAKIHPDVHFVYPVHLNPNVQRPVRALLSRLPNVHLLEPLDYEPFVYLMKHCHLVLTDSGGIQEEAPSLGKPVLVMRKVTERPEAVEAGTVRLVGADRKRIVESVTELLGNETAYAEMARAHNPYGDGRACERIVSILAQS